MDSSTSSNTTFEANTRILLKLSPSTEKDHEIHSDQASQHKDRKLEPEWLEKFLKRTFFEACSEHPIRRNELNKYCIDCDASLCQYCVSLSPHEEHRLLKIYRHVYKDVVPLDEIEQHIDCSQIQPYRCNKQLVIALTPLPHTGSKTSDDAATCQICKRKLIEYNLYNYCSISCKVDAFTKKDVDDSPPFLSLKLMFQRVIQGPEPKYTSLDQTFEANEGPELKQLNVDQSVRRVEIEPKKRSFEQVRVEPMLPKGNQGLNMSKRTRKRKGIPHRAPFF